MSVLHLLDARPMRRDLYVLYDGRAIFTGSESASVFEAWGDGETVGEVRDDIDRHYADQACALYGYDRSADGQAANEELLYHQFPAADTGFAAWLEARGHGGQ